MLADLRGSDPLHSAPAQRRLYAGGQVFKPLDRYLPFLAGAQQAVQQLAAREHLFMPIALHDQERHLVDTLIGSVAALTEDALTAPSDGVARL